MSTSSTAELLPGYRVDEDSGAWLTLPWPVDMTALPSSLGPQVIRWSERWLVHHLTGEPWRWTRGQKRFLHLWYALTPEGRFLYRSGVKRSAKGTGKDPFAAAWSLCELLGPVRFAGWDGKRPVGEPHRMALVQVAANSEPQGMDVLRVANGMVSNAMRDEWGVDTGITRTLLPGGGRIEILTNSERSAEGDPATAICLNESHHMTEASGGHKLAAVARRNVGKSPRELQARLIEFTNAHEQGANSVAEQSYKAWRAQATGQAARQDILYDSREALAGVDIYDERARRAGLAMAYSDAPWADLERLEDEVLDPRITVSEALRFYFNVIAANEDAWIEPRNFDACARPAEVLADREPVAMFLDCSKSSDATALVASRISDGHVVTLGVWQRPKGDRGKGWLAPREEVDAEVRAAKARWRVCWFGVDPSPAKDDDTEALYWGELIDAWHRDFRNDVVLWATPGTNTGHAVLFDMRQSTPGGKERNRLFTEAAERAAAEIDEEHALTHDGNEVLRVHAHNARRYPTSTGVSLGKVNRDSKKLVDAAVAMVGARLGRRLVLNSGKLDQKKPGALVAMW